jgi:hypothetical protein
MNKVVGFFQVILILAFGLFGSQKLFADIPALIEQGMWWIEDFSEWQVRVIGGLETLAAVGLVAPYVVKALPKVLVPVAAGGLALTMIGAVATHVMRGDPVPSIVITSMLFVMGATVAAKRFAALRESSVLRS